MKTKREIELENRIKDISKAIKNCFGTVPMGCNGVLSPVKVIDYNKLVDAVRGKHND